MSFPNTQLMNFPFLETPPQLFRKELIIDSCLSYFLPADLIPLQDPIRPQVPFVLPPGVGCSSASTIGFSRFS
jgi:hypothetical protein